MSVLSNKFFNVVNNNIVYPNNAGNVSDVRSPRQKFKFYAIINLATADPIQDIPIKSIILPEITVENKVVQQYNIKRTIQQKINYGTCTLEIIDTHDNQFTDKIYLPYFSNYYNDNNGLGVDSAGGGVQGPILSNNPPSGKVGYTGPQSSLNRVAIPTIEIIMDGGPKEKTYVLVNCMITSVNNNNLDYSDSEAVTYTVVFQPESIIISTPGSEAVETQQPTNSDTTNVENSDLTGSSDIANPQNSNVSPITTVEDLESQTPTETTRYSDTIGLTGGLAELQNLIDDLIDITR